MLIGTGLLWGSIGIVVRVLQERGASTWSISFWRFVVVSAVLAPLMTRVPRSALRSVAPVRLVAMCVGSLAFQLAYFLAVRDVGVATATLLALGLAPVVLTAVETVQARRAPAVRTVVVLALAILGLVLVTVAGSSDTHIAPHPGRGIVEAVLSALFFAGSTAWGSSLSRELPPLAITFAMGLVGVVALLPVVAVVGWQVPRSAATLSGVLWLGIVATVVAYGLFYAGLRVTSGSTAVIVTLLEPVTAVVLAAVALGEPLTLATVVGAALLVVAIAVLYLVPDTRPNLAPAVTP